MKQTTEIKNVLTNAELEKRLSQLRKDNWKIDGMAKTLPHKTAREIIDNWFLATRESLLALLKIRENDSHKYVYHPI